MNSKGRVPSTVLAFQPALMIALRALGATGRSSKARTLLRCNMASKALSGVAAPTLLMTKTKRAAAALHHCIVRLPTVFGFVLRLFMTFS